MDDGGKRFFSTQISKLRVVAYLENPEYVWKLEDLVGEKSVNFRLTPAKI